MRILMEIGQREKFTVDYQFADPPPRVFGRREGEDEKNGEEKNCEEKNGEEEKNGGEVKKENGEENGESMEEEDKKRDWKVEVKTEKTDEEDKEDKESSVEKSQSAERDGGVWGRREGWVPRSFSCTATVGQGHSIQYHHINHHNISTTSPSLHASFHHNISRLACISSPRHRSSQHLPHILSTYFTTISTMLTNVTLTFPHYNMHHTPPQHHSPQPQSPLGHHHITPTTTPTI